MGYGCAATAASLHRQPNGRQTHARSSLLCFWQLIGMQKSLKEGNFRQRFKKKKREMMKKAAQAGLLGEDDLLRIEQEEEEERKAEELNKMSDKKKVRSPQRVRDRLWCGLLTVTGRHAGRAQEEGGAAQAEGGGEGAAAQGAR